MDLEAPVQPLITDHDLTQHVAALLVAPERLTLWPMFLDSNHVPIPVLLPIDGVPRSPDAASTGVLRKVHEVAASLEASSLVLVLERPGSAALQPDDSAWADAAHRASRGQRTTLRRFMVLHDHGVVPLDAAPIVEA